MARAKARAMPDSAVIMHNFDFEKNNFIVRTQSYTYGPECVIVKINN